MRFLAGLIVASTLLLVGVWNKETGAQVAGNCGMQLGGPVIFCETFDTPNPGIQSRTGGLHPDVWGVSRSNGFNNLGQGQWNQWARTDIQTCNGTVSQVAPPNDIVVCNGQLREASNDNPELVFDTGGVNVMAMYPKQPFDFAGRTGTVSFDVSNDAHGTHAAWPEFWVTNLPVPAPFTHFDPWQAVPEHGFGVRFAHGVPAGQQGACPNSNNLNFPRWTVDSAIVVRNYLSDDTANTTVNSTNMDMQILDCVIRSPDNSGVLNHIELRISQNQIEVYASDAGAPNTLRRIAIVNNANLSLTRGLIWIEDVHYNADKAESGPDVPSQRQHTFVWDNVAFDGPFTYRDFSYDALDNNLAGQFNTINLGKLSFPNETSSWNVLNMPASPQAAAVRVLFNFYHYDPPTTLAVVVNGHAHSVPWPYPDVAGFGTRTFAVTVPITDLVPGTNVVQIGGDQAIVTSNVNIVLGNVPGGVPVLPGSNNAYPGIHTPPPTAAISANPASINVGGSSTLTWSSTNATACTASGGWTGMVATSGTVMVSPTSTTIYTLVCSGNGGTSPAVSRTVTVSAPPPSKTCTVTISPFTFKEGQTTTFSVPLTAVCQ